jgi:fructose-1,6-bisphosphatase/inositol monophosphatase family enzyme
VGGLSRFEAVETDEVLDLLRTVGEEVVTPRFRELAAEEVMEKRPGDLVTVADREAEELITSALRRAYPDALVLGEEATATDDTLVDRFRAADHAFTVDPVDGTKNFVRGSKDHAMMVAELRSGEVVRSWIWQPQHEKAYVAERGAGAWRNAERLERPPLGEPLRGVTSRRRWLGESLDGLPALELTWVCCGVDYPKLVEGAADYVLYRRPNPWDHAPGSLLLAEAGGFAGDFDGSPYAPQGPTPTGLLPAADRATYELVQARVHALPGA